MRKWADNDVHPPFAQYKTAVIDYAMNNAVQVPWYYFPSYDKLDTLINSGIDDVWNGNRPPRTTSPESFRRCRSSSTRTSRDKSLE